MGNPNLQPDSNESSSTAASPGNNNQPSTSINHFSHPHTLQLSYHQSHHTFPANSCSGCKLEASGVIYTCTICNYFLHPKCSQMPQKITLSFDENGHVLSLLSKPAYEGGLFNCDACGQQGNGFSYHCKDCGIDLHILCASLPMVLRHSCHPDPLNLTFSPPYPTKTFSCDICKFTGSKNWLYRCNSCEFDVHLSCVNMLPRTTSHVQAAQSQQQSVLQTLLISSKSTPAQPSIGLQRPPQQFSSMPNNFNPPAFNAITPGGFGQGQFQGTPVFGTPFAAGSTTPMQNFNMQPNNFMMNPGGVQLGSVVTPRPVSQGNGLVNKVAGGIASGVSQAAAGVFLQEFLGGGGGGGGGIDGGFGGGDSSGLAMGDEGYGGGDQSNATY